MIHRITAGGPAARSGGTEDAQSHPEKGRGPVAKLKVKQYMHGTNLSTDWKVGSPIAWKGEGRASPT
jgi:hypothetical protein